MNELTPSPCVRNCCLDDADVCIGCGRNLEEIRCWSEATEDQKRATILRAAVRRAARRQRYGGYERTPRV